MGYHDHMQKIANIDILGDEDLQQRVTRLSLVTPRSQGSGDYKRQSFLLVPDASKNRTFRKYFPEGGARVGVFGRPGEKARGGQSLLARFSVEALTKEFYAALYDWEVDLHERFAAPFPPEARAELAHVRDALLAEPTVLVHRDFQSSNLLWHAKRPWVIDFQGMRRGPALYDLASFLYDPYVDWGEAVREAAIDAYAQAANRDAGALRATLPLAGLQRLTQAIGAYHRLASVGQPRFLAYVPTARATAAALAEKAHLPALAAFFKD